MELRPPGDFFMSAGLEIRVAHTAELDARELRAIRAFVIDAFEGLATDDDWNHALGGMHALVIEDGGFVGHGSVVQRRLIHRDRTLRTGYVEAVAVRADRRRQGVGNAVMERLEQIIRGAYELGALGASELGAGLYRARGWEQWRGRTWGLTPSGIVRTEEEDGDIYVLPVSADLQLDGDLTCDWREGDLW